MYLSHNVIQYTRTVDLAGIRAPATLDSVAGVAKTRSPLLISIPAKPEVESSFKDLTGMHFYQFGTCAELGLPALTHKLYQFSKLELSCRHLPNMAGRTFVIPHSVSCLHLNVLIVLGLDCFFVFEICDALSGVKVVTHK